MNFEIKISPIGVIHSPFKKPEGTPIQPGASVETGEIKIFAEYFDGLMDLEGFSHIIVLYYFHKITNIQLKVKPFMDKAFRGVFSTRSPARPNRIGLSVVKLEKIIDDRLIIGNVDMLDQTPVIDIKPYVPHFETIETARIGWLENNIHNYKAAKDDGRF